MLRRINETLEHLDLTPRHPVVPGGKSIWGGILFLLYIPLLVLYLYNSLVPLYGPLPSCCACATATTPADSFLYLGNNATCTADPTCKGNVKEQLALNCDAAVDYQAPLLDNIRLDIALIICAGMDDGAPCSDKCLDVSRRWLGAQDYTSELNRDQALARCPSQVGLCDFKALYESGSSSKFPMSICRYPDLTSILTRLGAGLGLVNGLLVTVRMLVRAVWIRVTEKKEDDGKPRDYAAGMIFGILFNYFSVTYCLVSSATSKRMRYGAQVAVGLLIVFMKTPLVVSLVYLLGQFWAPMMIYSVVSATAYIILFRTLYCILRLETRSREQRTVEEFALINDAPSSPLRTHRGPFHVPQEQPQNPLISQQHLYELIQQLQQSQQQLQKQLDQQSQQQETKNQSEIEQSQKQLEQLKQAERSLQSLHSHQSQPLRKSHKSKSLRKSHQSQPLHKSYQTSQSQFAQDQQLAQKPKPHQTQTREPEQLIQQSQQLIQQTQQSQLSHRNLQKLTPQEPQAFKSVQEYGSFFYDDWTPVPLYPHSLWRNFLLGFAGNVFTFLYMLKLSWHKRNSGFFAGAMCGTSLIMLTGAWAVMYGFMLWPDILFDFPFPVNYPKSTIYFQSAYFTYTTICSLTLVYYLCSFLKARPEHNDTLVPGTKYQYRLAFSLSSLPVFIVFLVFFFGFYVPYTSKPMPDSIQDCNFPIYDVVIPFLGVVPGFLVFAFAKVSRIRWGAFAACGFSFLALSIVLNIFIFQYCLGATPHRRPFYPLVCAAEIAGSFIVIYGAIRPNRVRHTRKYDEDETPVVPE
eukprot:Phypoly_transcript_02961.p1 GENE.Phypoly_transcript_02961~~Phypoly_transcript_02961.p1  ORF type:complete len:802 (+),score=88.24 Phypoly_transcript_02961:166-2571(+)